MEQNFVINVFEEEKLHELDWPIKEKRNIFISVLGKSNDFA